MTLLNVSKQYESSQQQLYYIVTNLVIYKNLVKKGPYGDL
jgi:hypothetical protein